MPEIFTAVHRDAIVAAAARHRIPAVYANRISATQGELISYGVDPADLFRRSAAYVDRILRDAMPADLPVQDPTKFRLTSTSRRRRHSASGFRRRCSPPPTR
jgi:putative ABC transport system substrate-binding protein